MTETTLDLNQVFGRHEGETLLALKKSLDQFFEEYQVSGQTIGQIREMIAAGHLNPWDYNGSNNTSCIIGLYAKTQPMTVEERRNFCLWSPFYPFETMLGNAGFHPRDTPQTHLKVQMLDSILALCQAERSAS